MAKFIVCSVYDLKVKFFDMPMIFRNRGEAARSWSEIANHPTHSISKHPADFAMMIIGEFDDQTGLIDALPQSENLGLAAEFKKAPVAEPTLFSKEGN